MSFPDIQRFVDAGFALHWLKQRDKAPIGNDWQSRPVADIESLLATYRDGNNLGVRLGELSRVEGGYLHVLDLDIRDASLRDAAWATLARLFPDVPLDTFPSVVSGSGGEARHLYFVTPQPFKSKKLAKSESFKMVFDPRKGRDVKKHDWEIELFGAPKQVAMPPSIHPDTGQPYRWEREFDFDSLAFGDGPHIDAETVEAAGAIADEGDDGSGNTERLGLILEDAESILDDLPLSEWCEDRDGWFNVGMALKHEFGDDGYELWCEFSKQSSKFDARNQQTVWKSFKGRTKRPIRMATLLAAAKVERMRAQFDEMEDFDDEPASPAASSGASGDDGDDFDDLLDDDADDLAAFEFSAEEKAEIAKLDWKSLLHLNEEGHVKATLHNIRLIVENDVWTAGVAAFNEFTQEVVQRGNPGVKPPRRKNAAKDVLQLSGLSWQVRDPVNGDFWTEDKDNGIRALLEAPGTQGGYGIKVPDRDLRAAIDIAARKNAFHPVREYLNGLTWDGVARVERMFPDYLGASDDAYHRGVARIMMTAAVTRVFEPGAKFDSAVILEGVQGKRKSTFISILAKSWFVELDCDVTDTQAIVELLQGAWIAEMNELGGLTKADVRHIKAFISRQSDKVRLAYAKRAQEFHRQSVLIGSTNDSVYLRDETGGRRFLPVKCQIDGEIDTDRLRGEIDQLWAEALHIYRQMREEQPRGVLPLYLVDAAAREVAERLQESRKVESNEDALAGRIGEWLERPINDGGFDDDPSGAPRFRNKVCLLELWVECLGRDEAQYMGGWPATLGRAMRMITGWHETGKRDRFGRFGQQRGFYRDGRADRALDGSSLD